MKTFDVEDVQEILEQIKYPGYEFTIKPDGDVMSLQARYLEACVVTNEDSWQYTRKWRISPYMTRSEIVQTALKCVLTSAEHRVREHFKYKGEAIYAPHFDCEELVELARQRKLDVRPNWPVAAMALPLVKEVSNGR